MSTPRRRKALSLPLLMDLTLQSWETIARRTMLMAQNKCSPAEYRRMFSEKAEAATESWLKFMASGGRTSMAALLAPWITRVNANTKRLRKK